MKKGSLEITVGIFVLVGILSAGWLAVRLGQMDVFGEQYYELEARFGNIGSLTDGAAVNISGVQVGRVSSITIDPDEEYPKVVRSVPGSRT